MSQFKFHITYRPGKENIAADALSRKAEDLATQKAICDAQREATLFRPVHSTEIWVLEARDASPPLALEGQEGPPRLCALTPIHPGVDLTDEVLQANRTAESLNSFRQRVTEDGPYTDRRGLLLFEGRLVVPEGQENLWTRVLKSIYETLLS